MEHELNCIMGSRLTAEKPRIWFALSLFSELVKVLSCDFAVQLVSSYSRVGLKSPIIKLLWAKNG